MRAHLRAEGEDPAGWRLTLVTNLRSLGYVFNPASFYLCRDGDGDLRLVIVEVHNTFGERHLYTLRRRRATPRRAPFTAAMDKAFFVSPFIDVDGALLGLRARRPRRPGARRSRCGRTGAPMLSTSLVLRRAPLTDRSLLRVLVRHPLLTHRTIALIHWHALRLWLRGAPFFRHGAAVRAGDGPTR